MYMYTQGHSRFISVGACIPKQRVTSTEIMEALDSENRFGISREWLERATGICERRAAPEGTKPSELATQAAQEALEQAECRAADIDVVIYAGVDRDYVEPASAHFVQHKIGAVNAVAFDVTNACHGFMNAIHLMDALIATGQARRGLIATGERGYVLAKRAVKALKKTKDKQLFSQLAGGLTLGDAGAAMVMGPKLGPETGFMGFMLHSEGQHSNLCVFADREGEMELFTDMPAIVREHIGMHAKMYGQFMSKIKWKPEELARFVHHQVGKKAFGLHAQYSKVKPSIMTDTVTTMGNLASATIPLNLYKLLKNKEVENGGKVFLSGAGSGLSISQAAVIWDAA